MASTVKHYLPLRRTLRCPPEKRRPTGPRVFRVLAEPAKYVVCGVRRRERYGGRVQRGMKKSLEEGMLRLWSSL